MEDPVECRQCIHQRIHLLLPGKVGRNLMVTIPGELFKGLLQSLLISTGDPEGGPRLAECESGLFSDPGGCPGDQDGFAGEGKWFQVASFSILNSQFSINTVFSLITGIPVSPGRRCCRFPAARIPMTIRRRRLIVKI